MKYRADLTPSECERYYQRKLVPANIALAALSLAAVFSLLFGMLFTVKVHVSGELLAGLFDSGEESRPAEGYESATQNPDYLLRGVDSTITLSLKAADVFRAAAAPDKSRFETVLEGPMAELASSMRDTVREVLPNVVSAIAVAAVTEIQDAEVLDYDTSAFLDVITELSAENPDTEAIRHDYLLKCQAFVQSEMGETLTEEQLAQIASGYDQMVEAGTKEGVFSVNNVVSTLIFPEGNVGFRDTWELNDDTYAALKIVMYVMAGITGLALLAWGFLFLFSVLRIFTPNKKVSMWYVKLAGFLPFLVFFLLPLVVFRAVPKFFPSLGIPGLPIFLGGWVILSGVCILALWVISIFWCHPIKKKLRRAVREGKSPHSDPPAKGDM